METPNLACSGFVFIKSKILHTARGAHSAPPDPLAGFKPILCLVVFFIGPNCMRISLAPQF